jgi:hypothetical protein
MTGKYTVEFCAPGGIHAGIESVIASDDDLKTARRLYRAAGRGQSRPPRAALLQHLDSGAQRSSGHDVTEPRRRFPPPWTVEETAPCTGAAASFIRQF